MLPVGPSQGENSSHKLNLACWPMGNNLMKTHRDKQLDSYLSHPRLNRGETSLGQKDRAMFERVGSLGHDQFTPDMFYIETCLDGMGDMEKEIRFLETTFVPMKDGTSVPLSKWLSMSPKLGGAPANDDMEREPFGEKLKWDTHIWDGKKFIPSGTQKKRLRTDVASALGRYGNPGENLAANDDIEEDLGQYGQPPSTPS